jgi:hypothetical protein
MKLELSRQISETFSNFMKIRPVGAESLHADGQTDMTVIVAFRNFADTFKNRLHPV